MFKRVLHDYIGEERRLLIRAHPSQNIQIVDSKRASYKKKAELFRGCVCNFGVLKFLLLVSSRVYMTCNLKQSGNSRWSVTNM